MESRQNSQALEKTWVMGDNEENTYARTIPRFLCDREWSEGVNQDVKNIRISKFQEEIYPQKSHRTYLRKEAVNAK